jgi:hypothetical protein
MGAMKEYLMWQEEKGYMTYDPLIDDYISTTDKSESEIWSEYVQEQNMHRLRATNIHRTT